MSRFLSLLFFVGLLICPVVGAGEQEFRIDIKSLPLGDGLGDGSIDIVTTTSGASEWLMCNLHDDENTSVEASLQVLKTHPGRLVEVRHTGKRLISFPFENKTYTFDPNRIFTAAGVHKTLEDKSTADENAEAIVGGFGKALIRLYSLDTVDGVIALHNNTDERYSATSYLPGQEYDRDAAEVYIQPGSDTDDFFFVTDRRLFDALRRRQLNTVLQNNETVTDDGSLSVYCGQHGKPYVNVEAQHGHLKQQVSMLTELLTVLSDWPSSSGDSSADATTDTTTDTTTPESVKGSAADAMEE